MSDEDPEKTAALPEKVVADARLIRSMVRFNPVDEERYGHVMVPISRVVQCVAATMHEEGRYMHHVADRVPEGVELEGLTDYHQRSADFKLVADQLVLIGSAYDKMCEGQMPSPGEMHALKGDTVRRMPPARECLEEAAIWAQLAAKEKFEHLRVPEGQRSTESQLFYDLTDMHFPETDSGTIPGLLQAMAGITGSVADKLPDVRSRRH